MNRRTEAWAVARLAQLFYMLRVGAYAGVGVAAGMGIGALRTDPATFLFAVIIAALVAALEPTKPRR